MEPLNLGTLKPWNPRPPPSTPTTLHTEAQGHRSHLRCPPTPRTSRLRGDAGRRYDPRVVVTPPTPSPDCPEAILDLIARFELHAETYRRQEYNETQVRRESIDPFFAALGWDVDNEAGHAEAYKDVIHEDAIKVGGSTKAPDYCFRIGGVRKFFVEAKKPSVSVGDDPAPAYQLRRYAWTNKLPLSIVTDFEELAVYDCRIKPKSDDKPSVARVLYVNHTEYPAKWGEIASIFSKDAILKGSFDKYAESNKRKRGTTEVDDEFLKEIEGWRDELARNIALRNPQLSVRDLNYAVGKTIDRIIFLRMCEDRGVETYAQLRILLNGPSVYPRLVEIFHRADERYNSGLFHFEPEKDRPDEPDTLTPNLSIDDKVLKDIIKSLYYPDSPYEFSVMPSEILGQVYEQFLGKVIRLTKGHKAVVEEKPEVKKAGGVYYTPKYIVDYIVEHTVGELLKDKQPADVGPMLDVKMLDVTQSPERKRRVDPSRASRETDSQSGERKRPDCLCILDPACGSGSFLLGAYQTLLDWHLRWYTDNDPASWARKKTPPIFESGSRGWQLTIAEKKRILLNNIFGVDIDPQAVEVTKLSLLLRVLEGESAETIGRTLRLFHERALPDLANNIKCGNSLIGPDFYNGHQLEMFDEEERYRINVFDWNTEFADIMRGDGFAAVIGNPPYVRMEAFSPVKGYLREKYQSHEERADIYAYFLEKAVSLLGRTGRLGMIVSNKFIRAKYGRPLRQFIAQHAYLDTLADFAGAKVFRGATVRTVVVFLRKRTSQRNQRTNYIPVPSQEAISAMESQLLTVSVHASQKGFRLDADAITPGEWRLLPASSSSLIDGIRAGRIHLSKLIGSTALFGTKTGLNDALIIDRRTRDALVAANPKSRQILKPILFGKDIRRYCVRFAGRFVIYCHPNINIDHFPEVRKHLLPHRPALAKRAGSQAWYELQQPAVALIPQFARPRIVYPIIANECRFALDDSSQFINDKAFLLPTDDRRVLAVLNSRIARFYFGAVCAALEGEKDRYLEFRAQYVDLFPIPDQLIDRGAYPALARFANRMLELNERRAATKVPSDRTTIQRQIDATDRQIDRLVYELYGLTDDEIRIVEEATSS